MPTVTDANVVLGFINPDALAGGGLPIDRELAERRIAARGRADRSASRSRKRPGACTAWPTPRWRARCGRSPPSADAIRATSRMLAFGGNGPVHAATLARLLDISSSSCRRCPALFSALGMLFPEVEHHYVRTCKQRLDRLDAGRAARRSSRSSRARARRRCAAEGFAPSQQRFERLVDLRYAGANSELTLPFPARGAGSQLREHFGAAHEQQYGYRSDEEAVETMNVRVIARGGPATQVPERLSLSRRAPRAAPRARVGVLRPASSARCPRPICGARRPAAASGRQGPLLVEEFDSTTVVPPDGRARRIAWDTIEIETGLKTSHHEPAADASDLAPAPGAPSRAIPSRSSSSRTRSRRSPTRWRSPSTARRARSSSRRRSISRRRCSSPTASSSRRAPACRSTSARCPSP